MKRMLSGRGFVFAVILQVLGCLFPFRNFAGIWEAPLEVFSSADFLYFFLVPREEGLLVALLPLVAYLPAAGFAAEDIASGFRDLALHRQSKLRYGFKLAMQGAFGAFLASFTGLLVYIAFISMVSPMDGPRVIASWRRGLDMSVYKPYLYAYGWPIVIDSSLRYACAAFCWGLIGVGVSAVCANAGLSLVLTLALGYQLNAALVSKQATYWWSQRALLSASFENIPSLTMLSWHQTVYLLVGILIATAGISFSLRHEKGRS
jgi:hypothetical protein